jgi:hypothetical protein
MKAGGSGSLGAGSKEWGLCSRLVWFRTLGLHTPPLCDGYSSIWSYGPVGPTIWGPVLENGHLSPGVEREMCPWAIYKYFGDLVSNTSA